MLFRCNCICLLFLEKELSCPAGGMLPVQASTHDQLCCVSASFFPSAYCSYLLHSAAYGTTPCLSSRVSSVLRHLACNASHAPRGLLCRIIFKDPMYTPWLGQLAKLVKQHVLACVLNLCACRYGLILFGRVMACFAHLQLLPKGFLLHVNAGLLRQWHSASRVFHHVYSSVCYRPGALSTLSLHCPLCISIFQAI